MYTGPHASPLPHPWTCFGLIWIIWTLLDAFGHLWTQTSLDSFRNTFTHFCPFWPTYLDPSRPASAKILCHSCFGLPSSNVLNVFLWKISNVDCTHTPLKRQKDPNGFPFQQTISFVKKFVIITVQSSTIPLLKKYIHLIVISTILTNNCTLGINYVYNQFDWSIILAHLLEQQVPSVLGKLLWNGWIFKKKS